MDSTARSVYAQRQPLQLAQSRILLSLWSWVTEASLTACLLERPASASETLIAMQGNIHQSLLPHPSPFHHIFLLLSFRIQMFIYCKWLFSPKKYLGHKLWSLSSVWIFILPYFITSYLGDRFGAAKRHFQTSRLVNMGYFTYKRNPSGSSGRLWMLPPWAVKDVAGAG